VQELGRLHRGVPPHALREELELGAEVGLDHVGEDGGQVPEDRADSGVREPRGRSGKHLLAAAATVEEGREGGR